MPYPGLQGRPAIVTGAAGGIGQAVVQRLVEEGAKVVAVDIRAADMAELVKKYPNDVVACPGNVSIEADCERYVQCALTNFGSVQLFVNNAAILGQRQRLVDLSIEDFDKAYAVNLRGVFLGLQKVLRQMLQQKVGGSIVNVASIGALRARPHSSDYGTMKHAVAGLSKIAAIEYGPDNIRVNCICPGPVDTPMLRPALRASSNDLSSYVAKNPIPRMGRPAEIASFVAYLLSDEASFQTGGVYPIDGGISA